MSLTSCNPGVEDGKGYLTCKGCSTILGYIADGRMHIFKNLTKELSCNIRDEVKMQLKGHGMDN